MMIIAFAIGIVALALCGVMTARVIGHWRRLSVTRSAATALLAAHATRLDDTAAALGERAATVGESAAVVADATVELRADTRHLIWMFEQIPQARTRLRRALLNLVLPTADREQT